MNPLVKKEIRLLLPAWIAAMLLAVFSTWITGMAGIAAFSLTGWPQRAWLPDDWFTLGVPLIFALGTLFLGISSFGGEFSSGAFTILLSQPAERRRIWRMKTATLSIAFASVWLAAVISFWGMLFVSNYLSNEHAAHGVHAGKVLIASFNLDAFKFFTISALVTFSGGLWTTLLLRQITAAFWVTLGAPMAIITGIGLVLDFTPVSDQFVNVSLLIALFIYSIAGFFYARKLFFNAQDVQWTGGNLVFSLRKESEEQTGSFILSSFRNRFLTLIWKEIKLHEISLFLAIVLLVINFAAMALHAVVTNSNAKMALEFTWALWLLMPLLIGCSAVAEERRLGVAEPQLCLPVSRRAQFFIKFFIALILSVILGAVAPSVIERTRNFGVTDWPDFWIFYLAPAIFFFSFYASTLSRSTLQAIGLAIAIPVIVVAVAAGANDAMFFEFASLMRSEVETVGRIICMIYLGVPIFLFVLALLMFWNFKWLHENAKLWRRNAAALLVLFLSIYALTSAIYCRPWELLSPIEPPPGPARLSRETPVKLLVPWDKIIAAPPDEKLWEEDLGEKDVNAGKLSSLEWWTMVPYLHTQRFVGNLDGTNVSAGYYFVLAIQPNGSLWDVPQFGKKLRPMQIGSAMDWLKVGSEGRAFLLLKKNGTLWVWGTNEISDTLEKIKRDQNTPPARISDETDWTDIVSPTEDQGLSEKSDGTFWRWEVEQNVTNVFSHLVQNTTWDNQWFSYAFHWEFSAGVKTNGELWLMYDLPTHWDGAGIPDYSKKVQLGLNATWKAVAFSDSESLIMLRNDGTLWIWKFLKSRNYWPNPTFRLPPFHPVQLGNHSDWVALSSYYSDEIALATDGNLWEWDSRSSYIWLAPSRRPVYMGNIFLATENKSP